MSDAPHIPVMLPEVLEALSPQDGETYVDGTFGAGGYSRAILDAANCNVIGIDRDELAHSMAQPWKGAYGARLRLARGSFSEIKQHLQSLGIEKVDGIVLDLGVSSMQLDQGEPGFSFRCSDISWSLLGPRGVEVSSRRFDQSDEASAFNVLDLSAGAYAWSSREVEARLELSRFS